MGTLTYVTPLILSCGIRANNLTIQSLRHPSKAVHWYGQVCTNAYIYTHIYNTVASPLLIVLYQDWLMCNVMLVSAIVQGCAGTSKVLSKYVRWIWAFSIPISVSSDVTGISPFTTKKLREINHFWPLTKKKQQAAVCHPLLHHAFSGALLESSVARRKNINTNYFTYYCSHAHTLLLSQSRAQHRLLLEKVDTILIRYWKG